MDSVIYVNEPGFTCRDSGIGLVVRSRLWLLCGFRLLKVTGCKLFLLSTPSILRYKPAGL